MLRCWLRLRASLLRLDMVNYYIKSVILAYNLAFILSFSSLSCRSSRYSWSALPFHSFFLIYSSLTSSLSLMFYWAISSLDSGLLWLSMSRWLDLSFRYFLNIYCESSSWFDGIGCLDRTTFLSSLFSSINLRYFL